MNHSFVLIVEDDLDIRETFVEILEDHGFKTASASNGAEALKILRTADTLPCLILLDLMMPVLDGRGFRTEQHKDPRLSQVPVVVVSAFRDAEEHARALNPLAVLRKPPRLQELLQTVQQYC